MRIKEIISKKHKIIPEGTDGAYSAIGPQDSVRDFRIVRVQPDLKGIGLDKKGVYLYRDGSYAGQRRNTVHFTKNYPVASHMWGNWDGSLVVIIADSKQIDAPMQGYNPEDIWYQIGKGGRLHLGKDAVIMMPDGMDAKTTWSVDGRYGSLPIIRYSGNDAEARNKAVDEYVKSKVDQEYRKRGEYGIDDETVQRLDHQDSLTFTLEREFDWFEKLFKKLTEIEEKLKKQGYQYWEWDRGTIIESISSAEWTIKDIPRTLQGWKKGQPKNYQRAVDSGYIDRVLDIVDKLEKKITPIKAYDEQFKKEKIEQERKQKIERAEQERKRNTPPPIPADMLPQQIYLAINGVTSGPFTPQIIRQKIKSGQVNINNAHVWWKGSSDWRLLNTYSALINA